MENIVLVCLDERAGKDAIDDDASPVKPIRSNDTVGDIKINIDVGSKCKEDASEKEKEKKAEAEHLEGSSGLKLKNLLGFYMRT